MPVTPVPSSPRRKKGLALVLILIGCAMAISGLAMTALYLLPGTPAPVASESILTVDLSGGLRETPSFGLASFVSRELTVRQVVDALRRARTDRRVKALILRPSLMDPDWAKLQEVRDAIAAFRAAGKPTAAFLEFGAQEDYYVATACEKVYLLPTAPLDLTGVATYDIFLRGTLDKIGTYPDFVHVGDYKTAVNTFTEHTFTPAHREMSDSLNADAFDQLVEGVAQGRGKSPEDIASLVDEGPFLSYDAIDAGLVDDAAYEDEVAERAGMSDAWEDVALDDYIRATSGSGFRTGRSRIALLYAVGEIVSGESSEGADMPVLGSDTIVDAIRRAREDESVKAIVLRVDSPGGSTIASDVIWHELMLARDEKPLVVSMSGLAASGGYYIAAPGHVIFADPGTLTGSIGVYVGKQVIDGTLDKIGVNIETTTRGRSAEIFSPFKPFSDEDRAKIQEQVQDFYEGFLERVAESRNSTPEKIHEVAQGRVWTGRQAKDLGLVDELGGLEAAVRAAKERAGLPPDADVPIVTYRTRVSWADLFDQPFPEFRMLLRTGLLPWLLGPTEREALARVAAPLARSAAPLTRFRAREPLALMPYVVTR